MRKSFVFLLTLQVLIAEKPRPSKDALTSQDLILAAEQYASQSKFADAIRLYTKAISLEPRSASLLGRRGLLHRQAGSAKNALADCTAAVKLDPNQDAAYRCLALLEADQGHLDLAMQHAASAIRLRAEDPENIRIGEELTRKLGTHLQAENAATPPPRAAAIEPEAPAPASAPPAVPAAEAPNPGAVLGQELRARVETGGKHLENREFDQAIALFSEVLAARPDHREALSLRCAALVESGALDKALPDCSAALKIIPNSPEISFYRGRAYLETKQYEKAIEDLNIALLQRPDHAAAYLCRGTAYQALDDLIMALSDYTHAVLRDPKLKNAWKARGEIRTALGDPAGGKDDLARAASL